MFKSALLSLALAGPLMMAQERVPEGPIKVSYTQLPALDMSGPSTAGLDMSEGFVVKIQNNAGKPLSAYSLSIKLTMADGFVQEFIANSCTPFFESKPTAPGTFDEQPVNFHAGSNGVDIADISITMEYAQFSDGSTLGDRHSKGAMQLTMSEIARAAYRRTLLRIAKEGGIKGILEEVDRP